MDSSSASFLPGPLLPSGLICMQLGSHKRGLRKREEMGNALRAIMAAARKAAKEEAAEAADE